MQEYIPRARERAVECLEAYILENELKAGDALLSERQMCQLWNINRTTLRSAIKQLSDSGKLFSLQGSATRIAPRFCRRLQDLQSFSEYAKTYNFNISTQLLSFLVVECDKHLATKFKRVLGEKLFCITRLRILNDTPVLIETAYVPVELAPGLDEHDFIHESLFCVLENRYGFKLSHGSEQTSITFAAGEEASFLNIDEGDPVYFIASMTENEEGIPIEYCKSIGRYDVIEMESVMNWQMEDRA